MQVRTAAGVFTSITEVRLVNYKANTRDKAREVILLFRGDKLAFEIERTLVGKILPDNERN